MKYNRIADCLILSDSKNQRRRFYRKLFDSCLVVWPVLSVLMAIMAGLGMLVALIEGWHLYDGLYFSFVTGLTIGYGDLVPRAAASRLLAIVIGFDGILLTALFAAIGVRALQEAIPFARADKD